MIFEADRLGYLSGCQKKRKCNLSAVDISIMEYSISISNNKPKFDFQKRFSRKLSFAQRAYLEPTDKFRFLRLIIDKESAYQSQLNKIISNMASVIRS